MNVAVTAVLDPRTVPGGYTFEKLARPHRRAGPARRRFRRRRDRRAVPVHHPVWVDDPDYGVDDHIHRVRLDPPGDERTLGRLRGRDRQPPPRPQPTALGVLGASKGLEDGHIALTGKVHHCALDGASGADLMPAFFGLDPDPEPLAPSHADRPAPRPSDLELLGWSLADRPEGHRRRASPPSGRAGWAADTIRRRRRDGDHGGGTPAHRPPTPYNGAITAGRSIAFARLPLDEVKAIRRAARHHRQRRGPRRAPPAPCAATSATRRAAGRRRWWPPARSRCAAADRKGETGNVLSLMFVPAPHRARGPARAARRRVARDAAAAKHEQRIFGESTMVQGRRDARPHEPLGRPSSCTPAPGWPTATARPSTPSCPTCPARPCPIYLGGAEALRLYPMGPVVEGVGLNLTVMSYRDHLDVGLLAARALSPTPGPCWRTSSRRSRSSGTPRHRRVTARPDTHRRPPRATRGRR